MKAVGHLAGHPAIPRVDGANKDGGRGHIERAGVEHGRHQVEAKEITFEIEPRIILKAIPDGANCQNIFLQLRPWRIPLQAEAALVMRLDLGTQAKHKAPMGGVLQIPGTVGQHHWISREGQCNFGTQLDSAGGRGSD